MTRTTADVPRGPPVRTAKLQEPGPPVRTAKRTNWLLGRGRMSRPSTGAATKETRSRRQTEAPMNPAEPPRESMRAQPRPNRIRLDIGRGRGESPVADKSPIVILARPNAAGRFHLAIDRERRRLLPRLDDLRQRFAPVDDDRVNVIGHDDPRHDRIESRRQTQQRLLDGAGARFEP
jgi:hypothetical protein